MIINPINIKPGHSYILMCNHFSFLDGMLAVYLLRNAIDNRQQIKRVYMMILKKQMEKNFWLKYMGAFSIDPGRWTVDESLDYAAEMLSQPGNLLLFYPQGNLESSHIRTIQFKEGIAKIISRVNGDCQLIWSSNIIEYFESIKPSVYFEMLDCGTNHDFDFKILTNQVNAHHQAAIRKQFRFTNE
ncbi:MAG TPA: lysophospholipid acyltransferase family protein [Sphingobacteriaceae bacterium]